VRTPKVPRLLDKTGWRSLSISHEVLWSAMRLRIAFWVGSHFFHNFCANADAYSDRHAKSYSNGIAKSHCDGMPEADTGDVCIV
jgi:tRNA U38,U39,U40 pseudouridine synthase TruA